MNEGQEATRSRLLEATLQVLTAEGVARTTSRGIAAAAGVNLQAITYHFGSKDELVAQALVHAVRRWTEPARAALEGVAEHPVARLLGAVEALRVALGEASPHFAGYLEALAAAGRSEPIREQILAVLDELRTGLAARIGELRDAGLVAAWVDPDTMAALIVAAGDGFVLHHALDPERYAPERALAQVVQLLLSASTLPPIPHPPAG